MSLAPLSTSESSSHRTDDRTWFCVWGFCVWGACTWAFSTLVPLSAALALLLAGCATATSKLEEKYKVGVPVSRIFHAKYEDVELALKQAMIKYPQRVDNSEAGIFETDFVKGEARFQPPHKRINYSNGHRYRILVRLVRGKSEDKSAVKVLVSKQTEIMRDFFADPEQLPSDGLEEDVILYRIARELAIAKALTKATEKANQN